MFKVLVTDNISDEGMALLDNTPDIHCDLITGLTQKELINCISKYHALIVRSSVKVTDRVLAEGKKLRVIGRAGTGTDNIDCALAELLNIKVVNTPGANSTAVADHTLGLLLAVCRNVVQANVSVQDGSWDRKKHTGIELSGKTIGLIGLGQVGRKVAVRSQAFGLKVIANDPYIEMPLDKEISDVTLVTKDELFSKSDIISLHVNLEPETKQIINAETISTMKSGVYIINCARGELINESDLAGALKEGKVAKAALDVLTAEPLTSDNPLFDLDNVLITPHIAASTSEAQNKVGVQIVNRVLSVLRREHCELAVNVQ